MVLQRVRRQAQEDVEQAVVAHSGQGALVRRLVAYATMISGVASGILIAIMLGFGTMFASFASLKRHLAPPARFFGSAILSETRYFDEFVPRKLALRLAGLVMIPKDRAHDGGIAVRLLRRVASSLAIHFAPCGYASGRRRAAHRSTRQRPTCRTTTGSRPAQRETLPFR